MERRYVSRKVRIVFASIRLSFDPFVVQIRALPVFRDMGGSESKRRLTDHAPGC